MDHKFQINLNGIIDLLSNHLYSGPEVFVRELMQNATDDSDKYTVPKVGVAAAVQELFDLQPRYFSRPSTWWRLARDKTNRPVAFVLPVLFKEDRFWKDGRPQSTIFYMGVLPEFRGLGYALELVHEATRLFIEANCWRVARLAGLVACYVLWDFRRAARGSVRRRA